MDAVLAHAGDVLGFRLAAIKRAQPRAEYCRRLASTTAYVGEPTHSSDWEALPQGVCEPGWNKGVSRQPRVA